MVFNYVPLRMHLKIRIIYKWIAVVNGSNRQATESNEIQLEILECSANARHRNTFLMW